MLLNYYRIFCKQLHGASFGPICRSDDKIKLFDSKIIPELQYVNTAVGTILRNFSRWPNPAQPGGLYLLCRGARAEQGMNCYIETHVGRISEDPEAFVKV